MNDHKEPPKQGFTQRKLCFPFVGIERVVFFHKLLLMDRTINSDMYSNQLDKLNKVIHQKHLALSNHKGIVFHHNNFKLKTFLQLLELGWKVLSHSLYSLYLLCLDFHLFWSFQNSLNG